MAHFTVVLSVHQVIPGKGYKALRARRNCKQVVRKGFTDEVDD